MDLGDKDEFGLEKRRGDHLSYHPAAAIPADWQLGNPPLGLVPADTLVGHRDHQTGSSQCPPVSMASESFLPNIWSHPSTSHNLGDFSETNASNVTIRKPAAGPSRLDVGWNPPPDLLSKGVFLQTSSGVLPPSLAHFAADTAFIDRAARFSCFNAGNFSSMVNPFGGASESSSPHSTALRDLPAAQIQKSELNADVVSMAMDHSSSIGSPMKNQGEKGRLHGVGISNDESGERDLSGCAQVEAANLGSAAGDSSSKGFNSKKRKKTNQDMELDQAQEAPASPAENTKEIVDTKQKGEQSSSAMATGKPASKNAKDGSEASKEDYIHVRARRGQATNSHSLAERVRREKISERMKFLQDLVPGCSKVTGKAVMLDEIINYVQSLQRQVEFLSMKLATVNPRLDFNIEGLLSKDLLQSRGGPSSTIGFSPDIIHPQIHLPHKGLVQAGIPGIFNPSDALRRTINAQLTAMSGYKEPTTQMPNAWDDELHNVVQMTYGANPPLSEQDLNGEPRDAFPL